MQYDFIERFQALAKNVEKDIKQCWASKDAILWWFFQGCVGFDITSALFAELNFEDSFIAMHCHFTDILGFFFLTFKNVSTNLKNSTKS